MSFQEKKRTWRHDLAQPVCAITTASLSSSAIDTLLVACYDGVVYSLDSAHNLSHFELHTPIRAVAVGQFGDLHANTTNFITSSSSARKQEKANSDRSSDTPSPTLPLDETNHSVDAEGNVKPKSDNLLVDDDNDSTDSTTNSG